MMPRFGRMTVAAFAIALVAGCSVGSLPPTDGAVPQISPSGAGPVTSKPAATVGCHGTSPTASLPAPTTLPAPTNLPTGSWEAYLRRRGYLDAGVDKNTYDWGYRDPVTGDLRGFDIEMIDAVAHAIFGPDIAGKVHFIVVPNEKRQLSVASGKVDIVAETMTITCGRRYDRSKPAKPPVYFSAEYYRAWQDVLVPNRSPITSKASLAGHTVCAGASGATSLQHLVDLDLRVIPVVAVNQTDCLVMLQQGQVDAISTDDTILRGFVHQDPTLHLLGLRLAPEPYGMAISLEHPDFVQFVNAVLAHEAGPHGIWAQAYQRTFGAPPVAAMPTAVYDPRAA